MGEVITIKELDWKPWHGNGEHAQADFPNGFTASVLRGGDGLFYTSGGTYEIAVLRDGDLDFTTSVTDDVLGFLSEDEANEALAQIAALPAIA